MMLDKTERMNAFLDFYGMLLTEKQQSVLNYHYREDFSYSEIAELIGTSRTAVYDLIKRSEALLEYYEEKMQLLKRYQLRMKCYEKLNALHIEKVTEIVAECMETE